MKTLQRKLNITREFVTNENVRFYILSIEHFKAIIKEGIKHLGNIFLARLAVGYVPISLQKVKSKELQTDYLSLTSFSLKLA